MATTAPTVGLDRKLLLRAIAVTVVVGIAGLFVPTVISDPYYMGIAADGIVLGILALEHRLPRASLGLISLGHTAFFGGSAYGIAIAMTHWGWGPAGRGFAVVGGTLLAVAIGALVIRTPGMGFLMLTLAFGQMLYQVSTPDEPARRDRRLRRPRRHLGRRRHVLRHDPGRARRRRHVLAAGLGRARADRVRALDRGPLALRDRPRGDPRERGARALLGLQHLPAAAGGVHDLRLLRVGGGRAVRAEVQLRLARRLELRARGRLADRRDRRRLHDPARPGRRRDPLHLRAGRVRRVRQPPALHRHRDDRRRDLPARRHHRLGRALLKRARARFSKKGEARNEPGAGSDRRDAALRRRDRGRRRGHRGRAGHAARGHRPQRRGQVVLHGRACRAPAAVGGKVVLDGEDITKRPVAWRRLHGMARSFQQTSVFNSMSVRAQLEMVARKTGEEDLDSIIDALDLRPYLDWPATRSPTACSARSTSRWRSSAGRTSCCSTSPARASRTRSPSACSTTSATLCTERNVAAVLVEHDVDGVFRVCDRITVLALGKVLATGETEGGPRRRARHPGLPRERG